MSNPVSIYLREHCVFGNPGADSPIPAVHFNWAQSKSKDEVIEELLKKYDLAITYILEEARKEGENTYFASVIFYAESAARLAMWGARCVIESNYDDFPPDPEPPDLYHFAGHAKGKMWRESQIREDLRKRIASVAEFLSR